MLHRDVHSLPELTRPVRIVVTGDSTGDALGTGVVGWAAANPNLAQVEVEAAFGCGFLMGGDRRHAVLGDVYDEVAAARPDGIHLAPEAATSIASEFLGEQLIRAAVL